MSEKGAAIYLRSSKDRHDVSIESQRRELKKLALEKGLSIVAEFADSVESGKDEFRPGFQQLLGQLKTQSRGWETLLLTDTARLFRGRYGAQAFKHNCRKRGVKILYSKVPEVDPVSSVILESVFEAMDEVHSMMSKDKGLAGMAENVRAGFRAGGRAPKGYRLVKHETGAFRDGSPVQKSKLDLDARWSGIVQKYLQLRAAGASRNRACEQSGLTMARSSLVNLEWNALTYAGHTVWNMRQEFDRGSGYRGGKKRRPRSDWVIRNDTHPALITSDEAERILAKIENNPWRLSARSTSDYLLTGLLKTPDGKPWYGNGQKHYRTKPPKGDKGAWVPLPEIESAVIKKVVSDLSSPKKILAMTQRAQSHVAKLSKDPAKAVRSALQGVDKKISRMVDLAAQMDEPAPILRKVGELEVERSELNQQVMDIERAHEQAVELSKIGAHEVKAFLTSICDDLLDDDRQTIKDVLRLVVEKIELDPRSHECRIYYKVDPANRNGVASPRVGASIPAGLVAMSRFRVG